MDENAMTLLDFLSSFTSLVWAWMIILYVFEWWFMCDLLVYRDSEIKLCYYVTWWVKQVVGVPLCYKIWILFFFFFWSSVSTLVIMSDNYQIIKQPIHSHGQLRLASNRNISCNIPFTPLCLTVDTVMLGLNVSAFFFLFHLTLIILL